MIPKDPKFYQAVPDPSNINGTQVYFPVRITYPTGVNYRLGYTSYGQVSSVQKWVPTISGQGAKRMIASTSLMMPHCVDPNAQPGHPDYCAPLTESSLSFSQRSEWAENWQGGAAQTYQYSYNGPYGHEIVDPASRRFRAQTSGMVQSVSVIPSGGSNATKTDEVTYASDSGVPYNSNLRVVETKSTASTSAGAQIKRATFSYVQRDGMWLVENRDEYGAFGASLYRRTNTTYTSYPSQYILGLPQQISVHDEALTLLSRVTSSYDQTGTFVDSNSQTASYFIDASGDGVIQHDASYGAGFTTRGNLTSVTQSKVESGAVTGSRVICKQACKSDPLPSMKN